MVWGGRGQRRGSRGKQRGGAGDVQGGWGEGKGEQGDMRRLMEGHLLRVQPSEYKPRLNGCAPALHCVPSRKVLK